MRGSLLGLALMLTVSWAGPSTAGSSSDNQKPKYWVEWGLGEVPCAKFGEAYGEAPEVTENLYFTWAQGYMSGVNLMFGVQNKPPTNFALWSLQDEKAFIRTYCADHPLEAYEQAVIQLFGSLRHAQGLTKQ